MSGIVLQHTPEGSRALAGLRFRVITSTSPWDYEEPSLVTSDAGGRFHFLASPGSLVAIVIADGAGYHAPCPSGFDTIGANVAMELHVVADAILSSTGRPRSMPYTAVWVSGKVTESSGWWDDARPIAGATVELAGEVGGLVKSVTLSDADGRFFVCTNPPGVGSDQPMWLTARKDGYQTESSAVLMGSDDLVSLALARNGRVERSLCVGGNILRRREALGVPRRSRRSGGRVTYRFGRFTLDTRTRQLLDDDNEVHLSPKAFELLHVLVRNRDRAMSRGELHEHLWPSTFVLETNLATLVAEIRRALGDVADRPRYLRTMHRFGYWFIGDVDESNASEAPLGPVNYWVMWEGRQVRLADGENVLGRAPDATIWIDAPGVSRHHARILISGGDATVEDLGSKNGTYVRDRRVDAPLTLGDGDQIRLGSVVVTFRVPPVAGSTETAPAS